MRAFLRIVDTLSEWAGHLAAWLYFGIGFIVTYEVIMRYMFNAPTIWVDDVARIALLWATYGGAASVLKNRQMITIEVAFKDHLSTSRRLVETFALLALFRFAGVASWYGFSLWLQATLAGHITDSALGVPKWLTLAPVWIGFGLFLLQGMAQLIRLWTEGVPPPRNALEGAH